MATPIDPEQSAAEAGLRYVSDDSPGLSRRRAGTGFSYRDTHDQRITDKRTITRIKALAIPPAWTDVWICPRANGHIQATGRDAKGRKQYRYHPDWAAVRDSAKFEHMVSFAGALPRIRDRVEADLRKHGLPREKVLAAVVRLLETTLIRVGNETYAQQNKSYGLTTMRNRHVSVEGGTVTFSFNGKSGVKHEIDLSDRRLARVISALQDLPGQDVFQYLDENDQRQTIDSADVNAYLADVSGEHFTAKDFRTWAGTTLAAQALAEFQAFDSDTAAKKNVVDAIERVAKRLGNTPTVCRACYIHPAVIEAYLAGETIEILQQRAEKDVKSGDVSALETAVMALLMKRLQQAETATKS